jgi:hypothetical protein
MPVTETLLPYVVDLWTRDQQRVEAVLATAATVSIARMALDAAIVSYPDRHLTLTGPGLEEVWRPPASRDPEEVREGRGWTNDPTRLEYYAVR